MAGIEAELTHKAGPLPVWGYGVGFAGLYILWRRMHPKAPAVPAPGALTSGAANQQAYDANSIDPSTGLTFGQEADPTLQPFPNGPINSLLAQNPTAPSYPVGLSPNGLPGPVTNLQWARLAGDYLIGMGSVPTDVVGALSRYVQGQPLSATDTAIANLAQQHFGTPPEGVTSVTAAPTSPAPVLTPTPPAIVPTPTPPAMHVPPPNVPITPAPVSAPAPAPAPSTPVAPGVRRIIYTVQSGDTLTSIADRFGTPGGWRSIYWWNRGAIEWEARNHGHPNSQSGNLIFPGDSYYVFATR